MWLRRTFCVVSVDYGLIARDFHFLWTFLLEIIQMIKKMSLSLRLIKTESALKSRFLVKSNKNTKKCD